MKTLKVECIKSSGHGGVYKGNIYEVYGTIGVGLDAPYTEKHIYFVVFNSKNKWKGYPSFLFKPVSE